MAAEQSPVLILTINDCYWLILHRSCSQGECLFPLPTPMQLFLAGVAGLCIGETIGKSSIGIGK